MAWKPALRSSSPTTVRVAGISGSIATTATPWLAKPVGESHDPGGHARLGVGRIGDRATRDVGARAAHQREATKQDERTMLVVQHDVERSPAQPGALLRPGQ